jgi:hypothetical protein
MNVIFLDVDGVLDTYKYRSHDDVESKIKILSDICHTYNAKVVLSAACKCAVDELTMEIDSNAEWVLYLFSLFKKYNIEVIGRTPEVKRYDEQYRNSYLSMWKEDEIRLYLMRHPEIDHYCIIDDDDLAAMHRKSDLDKVRHHLVKTNDYNFDNPEDEGLQEYHKEEVGKILQKENDIKKLLLRYKNK